ncbi:dihydropteroate synthase [Treponema bryantii]|uniref:dihydropteroate synthase n=1 Tax=Treponema bryantii TaxID=163 RepID=A0A1H9I8W8_9SPIR|nr:dihydropteroate synthase [Treponema bryantii]SEQ70835.1 dihydropteroate synthase [Treponema bryantii]
MLQLKFGLKRAATERPAFVMGIVNVTPDSFYPDSRGGVDRALRLIEEGADILDIGGESTRPGYTPVTAEEEISRIMPVIEAVRRESSIPISIDTNKFTVFRAAFAAGADIWNDVTALSGTQTVANSDGTAAAAAEPSIEAAEYIAKTGASVILMHTGPGSIEEVSNFLGQRVVFCVSNGVSSDKIIVDPGIGFGKTTEQNLALIKEPAALCGNRYPVLMALSRKRCIGDMTGRAAEERLAGTLAADMISVQKGAKIIRVHDVSSAIDTLNVMKFLR